MDQGKALLTIYLTCDVLKPVQMDSAGIGLLLTPVQTDSAGNPCEDLFFSGSRLGFIEDIFDMY